MCAKMHVWRSEDNLWESVLSTMWVEPKDGTQATELGGNHLYLLCSLSPAQTLNFNII